MYLSLSSLNDFINNFKALEGFVEAYFTNMVQKCKV